MDYANNFKVTENDLFYDAIVKRNDSLVLMKNFDSIIELKKI